ncbi:transposable element protein, putative [Candida dubliniensis CD36]|uniref:Transposable element protein, putative n=1 Tax=Candida dubliniensis (strain CD36 / ATCC MYA-646 / CBS 7987 / NCPF 3949 / NRRL Y-17841) TaxID=573826 RepID=B9WA59_CANDC|nr:transposable element protein, putative [Candida dubliniensis CD36]CAX45698.1 transposable element protein, putative [Candida dubliniensis CD36]
MEPHADTDRELEELENMVTYVKNIGASQWPAMLNRLDGASKAFIRECVSDMVTDQYTGDHTNVVDEGDSDGGCFEQQEAIKVHLKETIPDKIREQGANSDMEKALLYAAENDLFRVRFMTDGTYRIIYSQTGGKFSNMFPNLDTNAPLVKKIEISYHRNKGGND